MLYKKIKCVDKFDILWANIEKYAKAQCNTNQVQLKYIIIPNVNDKKEYIKEFVDRVREVGVKKILIDIEMWWYRNNNNEENIKKIFELVKYMEEYIAEQKLYCSSSIILASAFKKYPEICEKIGVSII